MLGKGSLGLNRTSTLWAWSQEEFSIAVWSRRAALFGFVRCFVSSASSVQGQDLFYSSLEYKATICCISFKDSIRLLSAAPADLPFPSDLLCPFWGYVLSLAVVFWEHISHLLSWFNFLLYVVLSVFYPSYSSVGVPLLSHIAQCASFLFFLLTDLFPIHLWCLLGSACDVCASLFIFLVQRHVRILLLVESSFIPLRQELQLHSSSKTLTGEWTIQALGSQ